MAQLAEILRASGDYSLSERAASLEKALALAVETIERHAEDWNAPLPRNRTDVTLILPELKAALARSDETDPCHYCDSEEHEHGSCLEQGR